jgi:hypothetical protein
MTVYNRNKTLKELRWNRKAFLNLKNIPYKNWVWSYMVKPKNVRF